MDITNFPDLAAPILAKRAVTYPASVAQTTAVKTLLPKIDQSGMKATLTTLSGYFNRYYKSTYGAQSSQWLQTQIQAVVTASNVTGVTVKAFPHSWGQNSIIASIPGKSTKTIVVGAHLDSINLANPATGQAPGADDDGSGSVTILEALKVLLTSSTVATGQLANTIEFHWYSAEEGGLLGSQEIWQSYKTAGRNIVAMLQQDMTGYIQGTINAGRKVSIGVMMDYVDAGLTAFLKKVVAAVSFAICAYRSDDMCDTNAVIVPHRSCRRDSMWLCLFRPWFCAESRIPGCVRDRGTLSGFQPPDCSYCER